MSLLFSIVVPVLNGAIYIRRAIESALDQEISELEILVVDGGSTDGTQAIASALPKVRVIDAPDSSIYQALNIGIRSSRGSIIGHLNSDDRLPAGALTAVGAAATADPGAALIRGRASFVVMDDAGQAHHVPVFESRVARQLDVWGVTFGVPAVNACFVRAATYQSTGLYDETLRIAADREWLLRVVTARLAIHYVERPVYEYLVHRGSLTIGASSHEVEADYAREHLAIVARYFAAARGAPERGILRAWHAQEMVRLLVRGGAGQAPAGEICRAFRVSPWWPIRALRPVARAALRRWRSGQSTV